MFINFHTRSDLKAALNYKNNVYTSVKGMKDSCSWHRINTDSWYIGDMFFTGFFFAMLLSMDSIHSYDVRNWRAEGEPYCVNKNVSFGYKYRKE